MGHCGSRSTIRRIRGGGHRSNANKVGQSFFTCAASVAERAAEMVGVLAGNDRPALLADLAAKGTGNVGGGSQFMFTLRHGSPGL